MLKIISGLESFKLRRKEGNRTKTKVIVGITLTLFLVSMLSTVMSVSAAWDPKADVNNDGVVNILDIANVTRHFGSEEGDPNWNPAPDVFVKIPSNGTIDIFDLVSVAVHFGEEAPP